jgi:hypothetical protein
MAAVARSLGSPDSRDLQEGSLRVPCPLCGGLLHPVAGRCKHCKQDLARHRHRPPGAGAGGGQLPRLADGTGSMGGGLHGPQAAATIGLGSPGYAVGSSLGDSLGDSRDGTRSTARRSWLRNWPLLVILLAVIGMIVALVLLILPPRHASVRRDGRPLSNDNMQTDVLPGSGKSSAIDPWNSSPRRAPDPPAPAPAPDPSVDPSADPFADPSADPDTVPDDPADAVDDGGVTGGVIGGTVGSDPSVDLGIADPEEISPLESVLGPGIPAEVTFESLMVAHACARVAVCEGDQARAARCARQVKPLPRSTPRPLRCRNVAMAQHCVQAIEALPCDIAPTLRTLMRIPFCMQLVGC